MNPTTRAAINRLDRALKRRRPTRGVGFSTVPSVLAAGLALGYQLLVRLVPQIWENLLPGGFDQGARLTGWPGLVWRAAWFCHLNFLPVVFGILVIVALSIAFGRRPATKPLAWLMAVAVITINAAILVITMRAGMDAAGVGNILG